jgi:hypothetical protein
MIVVAAAPFVILAVPVTILGDTIYGDARIPPRGLRDILGAIGGFFTYTLAVVIASRLYQSIGARVKERS